MSEIKERRVWYYTCTKCHKARRSSMKKAKATGGICAKCRRSMPDPNQMSLINEQV